ncbi:gastrula zinc finger protein XlCGF26.1-like [Battus philenor]|uniref:gastrula zinc finger protein XlCGF26.1-like n=1 Tax=Battus philenor TaxID=42288 RepID=UPI0035D054B8
MEENIRNCCRICLDVDSKHVSVTDDPTVLVHIKSCLPINISFNDDLTKDICVNCVSQLCEFYNFQQNARCSQDWLESSLQEKVKKSLETKTYIQPLPDSEYNSDSLLEFLNNTANIEEYLNNLGKEDIPSIVNMLDKTTEHSVEIAKTNIKANKQTSPKKRDSPKSKKCIKMDIDVLDSDFEIVKELLFKETEPKNKASSLKNTEKTTCFACKSKFDNIQRLSQHLIVCDIALRTCIHCNLLFDSKKKMKEHSLSHGILTHMSCSCGKQFTTKELLLQHYNNCHVDQSITMGFIHRCKQCGMTFKDRLQLYKHAKDHLIKSAERVCDICGHTFIGSDALTKHKKEEHEKSDNLLYRCKICNETSPSHKEMYMHVQKHTTKQVLIRHLCESCGRSFASKATLLRHSVLHTQPKEQQCSFCCKKFKDAKSRVEHLSEHREVVMCDKCGQKLNKYKLDSHTCV